MASITVKMKKTQKKSGQVLLIAVMLLASVLTVTLTLTFKSTTETQLTKLEEESQKALSAAEAGIEAALKQSVGDPPIAINSLGLGGGFTGQASVTGSTQGQSFNSTRISPGEQYTVYLSNYVGPPTMLGNPYWSGNLSVHFRDDAGCPTLELSFIKNDNSVTRSVLDPCGNLGGSGPTEPTTSPPGGYTVGGRTYRTRAIFSGLSGNKLLIIRDLYATTRVGLTGNNNLPDQGKLITSEAKSPTGVTKRVELFQSFPQILSDLFVTKF